jgi:predicted esterase
MTSKSLPSAFARVCVTTSLLSATLGAQPAAQKPPAIALVDGADAVQWQKWVQDLGWKVIAPQGTPSANSDQRVLALAAQVEAEIKAGSVDPARVYLAGRGDAAAMVFFTISRVPDLWAAGAAIGGSPKPAIDSGRIFAVNFTNVPVLWLSGEEGRTVADQLKSANLNLEWQSVAGGGSATAVMQWLAWHDRPAAPADVGCETNSPTFARCYWVQLTKFDAAERNDVLPSTRIAGGSGASLDLGSFGFKLDDPGPGLLVSFLAEKYNGPLKMNDRIVALDGRPIENAKQYQALMEKVTDEHPAVVTVQRGKERLRLETRTVLPPRDTGITARVHAQYLPAEKEIQIVSRTATEMRVTLPAEWLPAGLSWNGLTLETIKEPGCWALSMQKEILHAEKCK